MLASRKITIIQGHPDPEGGHLQHGLAAAYMNGAATGGHEVRLIEVAKLDFPLLRNKVAFETGALPESLVEPQAAIEWAEHLVVFYPLWLGGMPACLKAFLEQVLRPGFAFNYEADGKVTKRLKGRSARLVVTMGMPALAFRWLYGAHSIKSFETNILHFVGIKPVRRSLYGSVEAVSDARREIWLGQLRSLGQRGL